MNDRPPDPHKSTLAESTRLAVGRRSFLRGALAAGAAGAAVGPLVEGAARATGAAAADGGRDSAGPFPFYGVHQAGIDRPPPTQA
jgi:deferrochelatase/peroxidase EfeB